ncbi:hypothetical protein [Corynebacterium mayonis]|uniref:hypothetical protein n=1 Tax=Corynebacterium mayonis TaxID=3062461 RepID=UPI003140A34F
MLALVRRGGVVVLAVVALVVALAVAAVMLRPELFGRGKQTITAESLGSSFNEIAELATEEYAFSRVGKFDEQGYQFVGRTLPFTGKNEGVRKFVCEALIQKEFHR